MKNNFFLCLSGMLLSLMSYSQNPVAQEQTLIGTKEEKTLAQRMAGTFEIIKSTDKRIYLLNNQVLLEIEKKRNDNKEVFYELNGDVKIRILPRSVINAPGFVPIKNE